MTARDHLIDKLNQIEAAIKEVRTELKKEENNDPELIVASCNELALAMKEIAEHAYVTMFVVQQTDLTTGKD